MDIPTCPLDLTDINSRRLQPVQYIERYSDTIEQNKPNGQAYGMSKSIERRLASSSGHSTSASCKKCGKKKKKRRRRNLNVDDECQQGDDTSLLCRFQSNGINATSVTANFIQQLEPVKVEVSEILVDVLG